MVRVYATSKNRIQTNPLANAPPVRISNILNDNLPPDFTTKSILRKSTKHKHGQTEPPKPRKSTHFQTPNLPEVSVNEIAAVRHNLLKFKQKTQEKIQTRRKLEVSLSQIEHGRITIGPIRHTCAAYKNLNNFLYDHQIYEQYYNSCNNWTKKLTLDQFIHSQKYYTHLNSDLTTLLENRNVSKILNTDKYKKYQYYWRGVFFVGMELLYLA